METRLGSLSLFRLFAVSDLLLRVQMGPLQVPKNKGFIILGLTGRNFPLTLPCGPKKKKSYGFSHS